MYAIRWGGVSLLSFVVVFRRDVRIARSMARWNVRVVPIESQERRVGRTRP